MSITQWILDHRWAITPSALEAIIDIASKNTVDVENVARMMHGSEWERYVDAEGNVCKYDALEAYNYPILDGTRRVSVADGVAILPVVGPLFPRANLMTLSGGTSVQSLSYDFNVALNSDDIKSIILSMDTPGGEVTGIGEFADMIYRARDKKQIIAYVYGLGASAGYWLASSASEIVLAETAEVGSIGVVAGYTSSKRAREARGLDDFEIVSSQSPNKRPDLSTDKGRKQIQVIVDKLADVFVGAVARNRGINSEEVIEGYGQGGLYVGTDAIEHGMADRTGSLEGLIEELQVAPIHSFIGGSMDLAELQSQHPEVYQQAIAVGRTEAEQGSAQAIETAREEGAQAENERIQAIETISVPGADVVIKANKFDRKQTKESIAALIVEATQQEIDRVSAASGKDATALREKMSGVTKPIPSSESDDAEEASVVEAMAEGINSRRK